MSRSEFSYGDRVRFVSGDGNVWPDMVVIGTAPEPDRVFSAWPIGADKLADGQVNLTVKVSAFHPDWLERIAD